jgi:diguanylate cyclase (GGDEF)-like protein/PAS domain S-box-containing protein
VIVEDAKLGLAAGAPQFADLDVGFLRQLLDEMHAGVVVLDRDHRIVYWNRGAERITGYSASEALGRRSCPARGRVSDCPWRQACSRVCLCLLTEPPDSSPSARALLLRRDGRRIPIELQSQVFRNAAGDEVGRVEILNDATAMAILEATNERLRRMASRDHLTGLPNRRALDEFLDQELGLSDMTGAPLSVVLADLDNFKAINDTWGHAVGDESLMRCAEALTTRCRPTDVVGRFGGDEFLVLLPGTRLEAAEDVAERLRSGIPAMPTCWLFVPRPPITMSLGVAQYRPGERSATLIRRVDAALYRAKRAGRDCTEREDAPPVPSAPARDFD